MEGRRPTKENIGQATPPPTQSRTSELSDLLGMREVARRDKQAPVAYHAVVLSARPRLYPPGRQPQGPNASANQPVPHHAGGRVVTRRELDLRVWGALQGGALSINHAFRRRGHSLPRLAGWALTFGVTVFGYVFFRSTSFTRAWEILRGMLGFNGFSWRSEFGSMTREAYHNVIIGLLATWFCLNRQTIMQWDWVGDYAYAVAFTVLAVICVVRVANPPAFVYLQF
jgi:hypothetical protein